jgi:hypothetical protein
MASEKAIYWAAVAVMAILLVNHFAKKYEGGCLTDRATATVQQLSAEASHLVAMGQMAFGATPRFTAPEVAMARVQGRFASMQAGIARQQAACARLEAQHARLMALQQMQHIRVICPRQRLTVEVPQVPVIPSDGTI